jgi:hypothetical protein
MPAIWPCRCRLSGYEARHTTRSCRTDFGHAARSTGAVRVVCILSGRLPGRPESVRRSDVLTAHAGKRQARLDYRTLTARRGRRIRERWILRRSVADPILDAPELGPAVDLGAPHDASLNMRGVPDRTEEGDSAHARHPAHPTPDLEAPVHDGTSDAVPDVAAGRSEQTALPGRRATSASRPQGGLLPNTEGHQGRRHAGAGHAGRDRAVQGGIDPDHGPGRRQRHRSDARSSAGLRHLAAGCQAHRQEQTNWLGRRP